MVECEFEIISYITRSVIVLIDTWWNVNPRNLIVFTNSEKVLIDTWWNVNILPDFVSSKESVVLIDTWWKVNTHSQKFLLLYR